MRFPLARAKLNAGARGRARPRMPTGDGDCHHRQQPNEPDEDARRGCVPGAAAGLAPWPGLGGFSKCGIDNRGTANHWNHAPIIDQNLYVAPQCTVSCACF